MSLRRLFTFCIYVACEPGNACLVGCIRDALYPGLQPTGRGEASSTRAGTSPRRAPGVDGCAVVSWSSPQGCPGSPGLVRVRAAGLGMEVESLPPCMK